MLVKELIEALEKLDPEAIVVMSSDGEGTQYSPLADLSKGFYFPENTWSGEVYQYDTLTLELEEAGYTEDDVRTGGDAAIILEPIN